MLFRLFRANETRVHELNYLFWECTTRCNLRCRHCGSDCRECGGEKDMPIEDFVGALDTIPAAERAKPFTVVLTGGEPLLRADLPEIGRTLRRRGVGWGMVSNGWLYDEAMHERLMAAGMGALTISLDGLEDEHDWMRGCKSSYTRAVRAIGLAARERRLNMDVVTCVNRRNVQHMQQMYDTLAALGVRQWRIFTVIPIGRALGDTDLQLTDAELKEVMEFIAGCRAKPHATMTTTMSCEGYVGGYERRVRATPFFCRAGINIASVLADGTIGACPNVDRERFGQGNIYKDSLWDVWNRGFGAFRDRSWARRGMCKNCKAFRDCQGNGMHNWHGDASEPLQCHYRSLEM